MGQRDDLLSRIRDCKAILEGQEEAIKEAKTPQNLNSAQQEVRRQKQMIANLRAQWMSFNPGKACPV